MMAYFVDTENVGFSWVRILSSLLPGDKLFLYYSRVTPAMPMPLLEIIMRLHIVFDVILCAQGPNAMDFQLCSDMGHKIALAPGDAYVIVSRDAGYDAAVKLWTRRNVSMRRLALPALSQKELTHLLAKVYANHDSLAPPPEIASLPHPKAAHGTTEAHWSSFAKTSVEALREDIQSLSAENKGAKQDGYMAAMTAAGATEKQAEKIREIIEDSRALPESARKQYVYQTVSAVFSMGTESLQQGQDIYRKYVKKLAFPLLNVNGDI